MRVERAFVTTMAMEAVVFDFDGLMVDTEWVIYETVRAAFAAHGHELGVEAWSTVVGINDSSDDTWWATLCLAAGVEGFDEQDYLRAYDAQDRSNRDHLPLLPGVEVLIDGLTAAGVPIGIASSSSTAWLERHISRFGLLDRFGTMVGADSVNGVGKPAPDVYLRACDDLGADPSLSVAIEDSAHGATSAKAAGMVVVAVPSRITRFNDFSHADLVVDTVEAINLRSLAALVA